MNTLSATGNRLRQTLPYHCLFDFHFLPPASCRFHSRRRIMKKGNACPLKINLCRACAALIIVVATVAQQAQLLWRLTTTTPLVTTVSTFKMGTPTTAPATAALACPPSFLEHLAQQELSGSLGPSKQLSKQFVIPIYTSKGMNNYKFKIRNAALIAAELNRTLLLPPMTQGKTGDSENTEVVASDVYDLELLYRFVPVVAVTQKEVNVLAGVPNFQADPCSLYCAEASSCYTFSCEDEKGDLSMGPVGKEIIKAAPIGNVTTVVVHHCFGNARPGEDLILWRHLLPPKHVRFIAEQLRQSLFGNQSFVSFHWRFEEGQCRGHKLGLCFRCPGKTTDLTARDIADVVVAFAGGRPVFLATDGRNQGLGRTVDEVKGLIANHTQIVELGDDSAVNVSVWSSALQTQVEQAFCLHAYAHIGFVVSSWDGEIIQTYGALRRAFGWGAHAAVNPGAANITSEKHWGTGECSPWRVLLLETLVSGDLY